MESSPLSRHQLIEHLIAQHTDDVVDAAICLWEQLAVEIASIIGEGGFNSLYARSVFLSQSRFPWLADSGASPQANQRFTELKMKFAGRTPAETREANILLMHTFTDILIILIGEELTTNILRSAWGDHAFAKTGKESEK